MTAVITTVEPATSRDPMRIALVLVVGMIMATLDQTIVNVAINKLSMEFHAGLSTIQWVATGYSLALGAPWCRPRRGWSAGSAPSGCI
ncbi:hypothetical protein ACFWVM_23905 [Nocardia fluminea]|uniref:hypothetical protein n=1 Tax=Nocardia fluminea TaxID=134984 RepID=UPI00365672AC